MMFERPENILGDIIKTFIPSADFLKSSSPHVPAAHDQPVRSRVRTRRGKSWYRDKLACEIGGQTAVPVPGGKIDIVTSTEIVEVHAATDWKQALGQIEEYGRYYPDHRKRIHLFGKLPAEFAQVQMHCQSRRVTVTWIA
jgi:hypothetical protein